MLNNKFLEQLKGTNYIIPSYLIKYLKSLDLDINLFILLVFLINQEQNILYDYKKIAEHLYMDENDVLESLNILKEKKLIKIEVKKNSIGIVEEYINIDIFYDKIFLFILDEKKENKEENNLYIIFEKEFGRTLSPIEYEILNSWKESGVSEELILAALKEAVFNGVNNLRYIDKIIFEWNKKGYKKAKDVEENRKKVKDEKLEIFDYDWLNEKKED